MKKIFAMFAHPDDEGAIAGTLAHYAQQGVEVSLLCATKGEVGEISDPALATPETLGDVRTAELEAACQAIGIKNLHFLGYRDSGMVNTSPNEDPRALVQADSAEATQRIVALIRQIQPDLVITFEPYGWYGHPDHRAMYRLGTAAYHAASDPTAYSEAGPAWQPQRLFYAVMPLSNFRRIIEYAKENNLPMIELEHSPLQDEAEGAVTHKLNTLAYLGVKMEVIQAHRTQFGEDHLFRQLPGDILSQNWAHEYFIQVEPPLSPSEPPQVVLFPDEESWPSAIR